MRKDYLAYLMALALLSLLNGAARASDAQPQQHGMHGVANRSTAIDSSSPAALIEETVHQLLARLNAGDEAAGRRGDALYALVTDIVVPHLDMPRIARIVLGKHARRIDAVALDEFTGEFRRLLVRTYATSLMAYQGGRIDVSQHAKASRKGTATVDMRIYRADGAPIEISFLAHNRRGPWLVYDIRIEGISLVSNYRSEFSSILRSKGVEGLIRALKDRNRAAQLTASR
ncbi:MAG: ABC transporter substrate-binding protein [Gammaproteobacteria bacterium]|jgi:phospholipid transport system substrate-binding protein